MATYKLIQDVEAEDHILGPLSLRQFIFALVAVFLFYINFVLLTKGAAFLLALFLPPALFCGFFAIPFGRDQPTEVWALAKLRFWFKPRRRVWNQSGVKELVTITAPKKVERVLTNGLDQGEVKSRLSALANTIDSRGWAIKNVDFGAYALLPESSDRLIDIDSMPAQAPATESYAENDIMDTANNPIARQFDTMISQSSQAHRQQLIDQMNGSQAPTQTQPQTNWFAPQATAGPVPVAPASSVADEAELSEKLAERTTSSHVSLNNMHTLKTSADQPAQDAAATTSDSQTTDGQAATDTPTNTVTSPSDPAILSLANNNDLNVSTLAREAHKAKGDDGEVVISLR